MGKFTKNQFFETRPFFTRTFRGYIEGPRNVAGKQYERKPNRMGLSDHWNSIARILGAPGAPQSEKPPLEPAPALPESSTEPQPELGLSSPKQASEEPLSQLFGKKSKSSGWNSLTELLNLPPEQETTPKPLPDPVGKGMRSTVDAKRPRVAKKKSRPTMFGDSADGIETLDPESTSLKHQEPTTIASGIGSRFDEDVPPVIPGWESAEFGTPVEFVEPEFGSPEFESPESGNNRDEDSSTRRGPRRRGRRGRGRGSFREPSQREQIEPMDRDAIDRRPLNDPDLASPLDVAEPSLPESDDKVLGLRRGPRRRARSIDLPQIDPRDQDPRDQDPRDQDPRDRDPRDRDPREQGDEGWERKDRTGDARSRRDRGNRGDRSGRSERVNRSARSNRNPADSQPVEDIDLTDRGERFPSDGQTDERSDRSGRGRRPRRDVRSQREGRPAAGSDPVPVEDPLEPVVVHKNIPTWLDAVDILIQGNMENRRREPPRRGHGRGR